MAKYNDPFYFAVPRYGSTSPAEGQENIRKTFGVDGKLEVVREELAFTLCRIVGQAVSA